MKGCDGQFDFAVAETGGIMPVDLASRGDPKGNLAVHRTGEGDLRCRVLKKDEELRDGEVRAMHHKALCKNPPDGTSW